jgi:hypothetical protein
MKHTPARPPDVVVVPEPEKKVCLGCGQLVVPARHCPSCHGLLQPLPGTTIRCLTCGALHGA